jgi:Spy/CpxP family protein refolding chaperone
MSISMLLLVLSLGVSQASARGSRWWLDADVQRDLALTFTQVAALEAEYDRTLQHRRLLRREFDAANAELTRALASGDFSDAAAEALVTRVEDLRRRRNVARLRLLVAMYFLLTPGQRALLPRVAERATLRIPARC